LTAGSVARCIHGHVWVAQNLAAREPVRLPACVSRFLVVLSTSRDRLLLCCGCWDERLVHQLN